jgi:uncharacterized protein YqjF (DUF2071 family)
MASVFLTAEWRKLIMANYEVDPSILRDLVPARTVLDTWEGNAYVSLVGFMFREVRVKGLRIPLHTHFPEVNLRFYVRYKEGTEWKRGVVFISEIVPRPAITWIANTLFREHYIHLPMRHSENIADSSLQVGYEWKFRGRWNQLSVDAKVAGRALEAGSKEEFITEHYWGYAKSASDRTGEYQVAHPRWEIHEVERYRIDCEFEGLYGPAFAELGARIPESVFLAEGSPVSVYLKRNV